MRGVDNARRFQPRTHGQQYPTQGRLILLFLDQKCKTGDVREVSVLHSLHTDRMTERRTTLRIMTIT